MSIVRDYKLTVMLSEEERATLQELADVAGVNASDFVRNWIHQQGFEAQVQREWAGLCAVHKRALMALAGGEKLSDGKLAHELNKNQVWELAQQDRSGGVTVRARWQAYRNAFIAANAGEKSLSVSFEALALVVERWMKRIRQT